MKPTLLLTVLVLLAAIPVAAQNAATTDSNATMSAEAAAECWYDPSIDEPAGLGPSYVVPCDDPSCNVGPCESVDAKTGVMASSSVPAHTPEWTNLNDSDPGVSESNTVPAKESGEKSGTEDINIGVGELQEGADEPRAAQRNESDLDFQRERAEESSPNMFSRIWRFLTGWLW